MHEKVTENRKILNVYMPSGDHWAVCECKSRSKRQSDVSGFENMRERDSLICDFLPCPVPGHITAFSEAVVGSVPVGIGACACLHNDECALLLAELKMLSELPLDLF